MKWGRRSRSIWVSWLRVGSENPDSRLPRFGWCMVVSGIGWLLIGIPAVLVHFRSIMQLQKEVGGEIYAMPGVALMGDLLPVAVAALALIVAGALWSGVEALMRRWMRR